MEHIIAIADIFPALINKDTKRLNKNASWRKRGPGRRHNHLTATQQNLKDYLMTKGGMNATQALSAILGH